MKLHTLILSLVLAAAMPFVAVAGPLDINTADADALAETLKGVGPKKAVAIVRDRQQNGPFRTVDELARVAGIGPRVVEDNRARITAVIPDKTAKQQK